MYSKLIGTFTFLKAARTQWLQTEKRDHRTCRFHHISTDKVFDSLQPNDPAFTHLSPLHLATNQLHTKHKHKRDIIECLIQRGANPKAVNENNKTPLQYLLNQGKNFNLAEIFITHGEVPEENALLHRLELNLCNTTISLNLFLTLLRAAPNLGTLTLNHCTITKDSTNLNTTTLPSNALLCLKQIDVSHSIMPPNYLFELLGFVLQAAPNLNGMTFPSINEPEFNRTMHTIFKSLHEKSNHPYATKSLAGIYETGKEGINQDLFYAKKLYAMLSDAESVARVEAKLKERWNPGLFSSLQTQSTEKKRPSEGKGSSSKRQKP